MKVKNSKLKFRLGIQNSKKAHGVALMVVAIMGILFFFIYQSHYEEINLEMWIGESQKSLIESYSYPEFARIYVSTAVKYAVYELLYNFSINETNCNPDLIMEILSNNFTGSNINTYLFRYAPTINGIDVSLPFYYYDFKKNNDGSVSVIGYGYYAECYDITPEPEETCLNKFIKEDCEAVRTCYYNGSCDDKPACKWEGEESSGYCIDNTPYPMENNEFVYCSSFNETECPKVKDNLGNPACKFSEQYLDYIKAYSPQLYEYSFVISSDAYFNETITCRKYLGYYNIRKNLDN